MLKLFRRILRASPSLTALFPWIATLLSACAVAPIWASRFLPLLDDPNHLSAIYIWRELLRPKSPLHEYYALAFAPVSYLLHYTPAWLLSFVVGVETAHKLVLSLYVLSFPCAAFFWCRATGRSVWLSFTTVPLAYSISWAHGYHAFDAGLGACLFAVVTQDRLLAEARLKHWVVAAVTMILCYFGHPLTLATSWLCTAVLWDARRPGLRTIAASIASILPSLSLYIWEGRATPIAPGGVRAVLGPDFPVLDPMVWRARAVDFVDHAVSPLPGSPNTRIFYLVMAGAALLLVIGARQRASYRSLALALVLLALYLVLPEHFNEPVYVWIARGRLTPLIAFFFLLTPAIGELHWARWIALAMSLLAAAVPLSIVRSYRAFGTEMNAFVDVLEACPANAQILTLRIGGSDQPPKGFALPVLRQLPSWVQVVHGGYNPSMFPRSIPFPFKVKKDLPAPHWRAHEFYQPFLDPTIFGCVLTHNLTDLGDGRYRLARRNGPFALYTAASASQPLVPPRPDNAETSPTTGGDVGTNSLPPSSPSPKQ